MKLDYAVGACIVHDDKVLVLEHTKLKKWLLPGGHIDPNETPDAAIIREVKEETGLDIMFLHTSPPTQATDEKEHLHIPFWTNVHSVGDHDHYCMYFLCTPKDLSTLAISHESTGMRWVTRRELEELNAPENVKDMARWALMRHRWKH